MTQVTVSLPDEVVARLKEKLEPHGYSVEQFASSSLSSFAEAGEFISPELEAKVLEGLDSPLIDAEQVDWDAKISALKARSNQQAP